MVLIGISIACQRLGLGMVGFGLCPLTVLPRLLRAGIRDPAAISATDEFAVCQGIANETGDTLSAPFTRVRCIGLQFEGTECQPVGAGVPWFQVHLDDGVATVPFTLAGQLEHRHGATIFDGNLVIGDCSPDALVATDLWDAAFIPRRWWIPARRDVENPRMNGKTGGQLNRDTEQNEAITRHL